jgi:hypothetical protein
MTTIGSMDSERASRNDDHDNSFFYNTSPFNSRGTSPINPAA